MSNSLDTRFSKSLWIFGGVFDQSCAISKKTFKLYVLKCTFEYFVKEVKFIKTVYFIAKIDFGDRNYFCKVWRSLNQRKLNYKGSKKVLAIPVWILTVCWDAPRDPTGSHGAHSTHMAHNWVVVTAWLCKEDLKETGKNKYWYFAGRYFKMRWKRTTVFPTRVLFCTWFTDKIV